MRATFIVSSRHGASDAGAAHYACRETGWKIEGRTVPEQIAVQKALKSAKAEARETGDYSRFKVHPRRGYRIVELEVAA